MSVISNTTVLSNFAAIDALDKLGELYKEVYPSVYKEVERGLEEGYTFYSGIEKILHLVNAAPSACTHPSSCQLKVCRASAILAQAPLNTRRRVPWRSFER